MTGNFPISEGWNDRRSKILLEVTAIFSKCSFIRCIGTVQAARRGQHLLGMENATHHASTLTLCISTCSGGVSRRFLGHHANERLRWQEGLQIRLAVYASKLCRAVRASMLHHD